MIILLGATGYIGSAFAKKLAQGDYAWTGLSRAQVDYTNPLILRDYLKTAGATFLINCAGFTGKPNVDACEWQKPACLEGNAVLPGRIADVCAELQLPWGHVSSGCIYTGDKGTSPEGKAIGFTEEDEPNFCFRQPPCSFYSGSKALGEEVLKEAPQCYIWRVRIPFDSDHSPRNYLSKLLIYDTLLEARNSISHLGEFAATSLATWEKQIPYGIYNITNPGSITTREVTEMLLKHGITTKKFKFFVDEVDFMKTAAKTPRSNCVLDVTKLKQQGIAMREVHVALHETLSAWNAGGVIL